MCQQYKIMLCERVTRLPSLQTLNTQLSLAHVVMETLRNHTQQKLLSYSEKVQTVAFLMCIRELHGTNVPRETDGHLQSIRANIVIRSQMYFFFPLFPVYHTSFRRHTVYKFYRNSATFYVQCGVYNVGVGQSLCP